MSFHMHLFFTFIWFYLWIYIVYLLLLLVIFTSIIYWFIWRLSTPELCSPGSVYSFFCPLFTQWSSADGMPPQSSARNLLSVTARCINPLCPVRVVTWLKECVWWRTWTLWCPGRIRHRPAETELLSDQCEDDHKSSITKPTPKHSEVHHSRRTGLFNLTWKRQISLIFP